MMDAREFVSRDKGRKQTPKVHLYVEITQERDDWLRRFIKRTGRSKVEVIEAGIDALRQAEQEMDQAA